MHSSLTQIKPYYNNYTDTITIHRSLYLSTQVQKIEPYKRGQGRSHTFISEVMFVVIRVLYMGVWYLHYLMKLSVWDRSAQNWKLGTHFFNQQIQSKIKKYSHRLQQSKSLTEIQRLRWVWTHKWRLGT